MYNYICIAQRCGSREGQFRLIPQLANTQVWVAELSEIALLGFHTMMCICHEDHDIM